MKLAALLLPIAIGSAGAAALSLLLGAPALDLFGFAALAFLVMIAAHDYAPRSALASEMSRVNRLRLAA